MSNDLRKKIFIFGFPLLSIFLLTVALVVRKYNLDSRTEASSGEEIVEEEPNSRGFPYVVSLDPKVAVVGEEFTYYLRIVDSDTKVEDIILTIKEGPSWLQVNSEEKLLHGIPTFGTSNTVKVVLNLYDGKNSVDHTFYLLLSEDGEDIEINNN